MLAETDYIMCKKCNHPWSWHNLNFKLLLKGKIRLQGCNSTLRIKEKIKCDCNEEINLHLEKDSLKNFLKKTTTKVTECDSQ